MAIFKQIHNKFWQNDFVLGLTAEERYFYIYLITNSMTNQCGVYKFNRRLAELETGYKAEKIEELLVKFQQSGKVVISETTTEIMLINWLKHNFKNSNKVIHSINKEIRDVKDKVLLQKLYESGIKWQFSVSELFSGVLLPGAMNQNDSSEDKKDCNEAAKMQVNAENSIQQEDKSKDSGIVCEESIVANNLMETDSATFSNLKIDSSATVDGGIKKENLIEEMDLTNYEEEDDSYENDEWTAIESWSFAEESEAKEDTAAVSSG